MNARNPISAGLTALGVILASLLLWTAPALGLVTDLKAEVGQGTLEPSSDEEFGIAVDNSTGEMYVTQDGYDCSIGWYEFDSTGSPLAEFPQEIGCYGHTSALAVDNSASPSNGDIYLADPSEQSKLIYRRSSSDHPVNFTAVESYITGSEITGTPSGPFVEPLGGVAVGPSGDIYFADGNVIDVYKATGEYERQLSGTETPAGSFEGRYDTVAVDASGDVYVADNKRDVIDIFNAEGKYERQLTGTPGGPFGLITGVAVDSDGNVYVADSEKAAVDVFDAKGEYEREETGADTAAGHFGILASLTIDSKNDLYVGDNDAGLIYVFYPTPVTLPDVTTGKASNEQATSVSVSGTVDPDGVEASCAVQYGPSGSALGKSVPCEPANVGSGTGDLQVSASLPGLEPNHTYEYQVVATNSSGSNRGARKAVTTLPAKPIVLSESASSLTTYEAILAGIVNPGNGETTYYFAVGQTNGYGTRFPGSGEIALGGGEAPILTPGLSIGGLQPDTTYHYALVATNAGGTTYGPDQTFTTAPPLVPSADTGAATGISQNGVTLTGTVDPDSAETSYEFDLGTDTAYGTRVFASAESGTEPVNVSAVFASLAPATTYHYRLVASNEFGTGYGADETFTTPGFPTSVLGYPATLGLVAMPPIVFPPATAAAPEPASSGGHGKRTTTHRGKRKKGKGKKSKGKGKGRKSSVGSGRARRGDRGRSGK